MRMLPILFSRVSPVTAGAPLLFAAVLLAGCASKNPLIDEPVAASKKPAVSAPSSTAQAEAPPAAPTQAATAKPATTAATGVQTTTQRRFLGIFSPYRIDIQQGNFVSREMVDQLKEGMTPDQVRFVLGTPLLTDIFHADRWDYPFRLMKGNGEVVSSRVTVYFKDNRLARIEGGDLPTEEDFLRLIAGEGTGSSSRIISRPSATAPAQQSSPSPTDPIHRRR